VYGYKYSSARPFTHTRHGGTMTTVQSVTENEFPLLVEPTAGGRIRVEGYTSIHDVFSAFVRLHPAARKHEFDFVPAPWRDRAIKAQPFIHVLNERIDELVARWKSQLNVFIAARGSELVRTCKTRDLSASEHVELAEIKQSCPHHDSPAEFKTNGENCELCGSFI